MYQISRIYLIHYAIYATKLTWHIFGCKEGQNDPITMKPDLNVLCYLSNVYTKFQKHVDKWMLIKT